MADGRRDLRRLSDRRVILGQGPILLGSTERPPSTAEQQTHWTYK